MSPMPADPHCRSYSQRASGCAAAAVVLVVGLVLVGWWLELAPLKSVLRNLPEMVPNTALSLVLAGAALGLLRNEPIPRFGRWLARAASAAVVFVGLVTLAEYIFGLDLYIDRFLTDTSRGTERDPLPGRPGFPTAWALVLIGVALWSIDVRLRHCPELAQGLILLAATIALLAVIGSG